MADEIRQTVVIEAELTTIQGQLKTLEGNFGASFGKIQSLGESALGALGVGLGIGGLVAAGKQILDLADNLQNLHEQSGLSIELLSGLKSPLEEAGTSIGAFGKGVFNLQKNLGNVDKETDPAALAIKRLGLNLDDLRNSSPDDFIKKVTDALGRIENPIERITVLFNLLGKLAQELGPAFQQLVGRFDELKRNGLSAEDVKLLDDFGDALTRLKNQALLLGAEGAAGLLRFFSVMRDGPKIASDLQKATERAAHLFDLPVGRVEGMSANEIRRQAEIPTRFADNPEALRMARDDVLNLREEFDKLNATAKKVPQAPFKPLSDNAKSAKVEVDNFFEQLRKQAEAMQVSVIELSQGALAAKELGLNLEFAAFKAKLLAEGKVVPAGTEAKFQKAKEEILGFAQALARAKLDADLLKQSLEEMDKAFPEPLMPGEMIDKLGPAGKIAGGGIVNEDDFKKLKDLQKQWDELGTSLALGSFDTGTPQGKENQRIAQIYVDFKNTADKIEQTGRELGLSQEEIADATAQAWQNALTKINDQADESTKFWQRAIEKIQDSVASGIEDILSGNVKSWEEWGSSIKKVIDQLVAQFLAAQLNAAIFGPNAGKTGGGTDQMGRLLGSLLGSFGGGFGSAPAGVEGPAMEGGGFFSSALGWLTSFFHDGGVVGVTPAPAYMVDSSVFRGAQRYHSGGMALQPGEIPAILQTGETVLPRGKSAARGGSVYNFTFNGVENFDSFRRSRPQLLADLTRAVERGKKHL